MPRIVVWVLFTIGFFVVRWGIVGFSHSSYNEVLGATAAWLFGGLTYHLIFGVAPNRFGK